MKLYRTDDAARIVIIELAIRLLLVGLALTVLGATFTADIKTYLERAQNIGWHNLPYRDFLWEYPPLAAVPLLVIPLTGRSLNGLTIGFAAITIALEYFSLRMLRAHRPDRAVSLTRYWNVAVLPTCCIAWFRMDAIPTFFATISLIAMMQGRSKWWPVVGGFAAKLWPVIFLAPMVLQRQWRNVVTAVVGLIVVTGAWYAFSPDGFHQFLKFREGGGFQIESLPGALLLFDGRYPVFAYGAIVVSDDGWKWVQTLLNAVLVSVPVLMFVAAALRRARVDFVAMMAAFLTLSLVSNRLLSPQFLLWLAPFMALLWLQHRWVGIVYGIAAWLTFIEIECYRLLVDGNDFLRVALVVRNAVLVVLCVMLIYRTFKVVEQPAATSELQAAVGS